MTSSAVSLDQIDLLDAGSYAERGYPWEEWALLRREAPVYWYERAGVSRSGRLRGTGTFSASRAIRRPFRATCNSSSRRATGRADDDGREGAEEDEQDEGSGTQLMINMDPPEHGRYRGYVNRRFSPRGMRFVEERIEAIAAEVVSGRRRGWLTMWRDEGGLTL